MFNNKITKKIRDLHENHGAIALKASFEDEGVTDSDLSDLVLLSGGSGMDVYVKIGGCEANRDIEKCLRLGIKGVVAPMVESSFAASKFIESMQQKASLLEADCPRLFINLETRTACSNTKEILKNHHNSLSGIVVGRSDLSKSLGLTKENVNDPEVMTMVKKTLETAKSLGLQTKMGGTVSKDSVGAISELYESSLLDYFETRAVIYRISKVKSIERAIKSALEYEQMLLEKRHSFHKIKSDFFFNRTNSIENRK